jgi:hypothetical protein
LQRERDELKDIIVRNLQDPGDLLEILDEDTVGEIHRERFPFCDCPHCNAHREQEAYNAAEAENHDV